MAFLSIVVIPSDENKPLETLSISTSLKQSDKQPEVTSASDSFIYDTSSEGDERENGGGDVVPRYLLKRHHHQQQLNKRTIVANDENIITDIDKKENDEDIEIQVVPLQRFSDPTSSYKYFPNNQYGSNNQSSYSISSSGLYAYLIQTTRQHSKSNRNNTINNNNAETDTDTTTQNQPNIRAARLSMACGLHSQRFYGTVYISRFGYAPSSSLTSSASFSLSRSLQNISITRQEIEYACCVSPDLRMELYHLFQNNETIKHIKLSTCILQAAKENYEDQGCISRLASVMNQDTTLSTFGIDDDDSDSADSDESEDSHDDDTNDSHGSNEDVGDHHDTKGTTNPNDERKYQQNPNISISTTKLSSLSLTPAKNSTQEDETPKSFIRTKKTLCLHCRKPAEDLCPGCQGAYFCSPPRLCSKLAWSHACVCQTWKAYTDRRNELSTFPFQDATWYKKLTHRQFQLSEEPYRVYLRDELGVLPSESSPNTAPTNTGTFSWWVTEIDGWEGGLSGSARNVDLSIRRSYQDGFRLSSKNLESSSSSSLWIPTESHITKEQWEHVMNIPDSTVDRNEDCNLIRLNSWLDYYRLRNISMSSPVALLLTFPLTMYYSIVKYGSVPITVSRMLKRVLRIHVVGVEKEINFIDLFKEVGYLLQDLELEIVFIVREDMLPPKCTKTINGKTFMSLTLTSNVTIYIQSGTYGGTVDPMFDCGTGPPDMLIGMNAGLYAYDSWRTVISFLDANEGVVGVFTDYNEHSGVNCASLGGLKARESFCVNPFRQPRTMPVYSMNLPQFSNGFIYVYNEQEIDM